MMVGWLGWVGEKEKALSKQVDKCMEGSKPQTL
jgi:hypothetical protein